MNEEMKRQMAALRAEYLESARAVVEHLEAEAERLGAGRLTHAEVAGLRQRVHKVRGSGGFYGFPEISAAAANLEDSLILFLQDEQPYDGSRFGELARALAGAIRLARLD